MIRVNVEPKIDAERTAKILSEIEKDSMGGWFKLPFNIDTEELARIKAAAEEIKRDSEILVCIGIGGSYLGHRAVIEALGLESGMTRVKIVYAGNSLSERELEKALALVGERDFSVNVISKSGTTLEPARAFEAFKRKLIEKYGEDEAKRRIYATTDASSGTLHDEALREGYTRFVVPDDIGGRYSVLSSVGLLPMCAAGVDVDKLLEGARKEAEEVSDLRENKISDISEVKYAWMRYALGSKGYDMEVFASFEPCTVYFNEWLKQLFGESEGKDRQGVWPASVVYSTDLHSLGQYMQDGRRNIWETIIDYPTDETNAMVVAAVKTAHTAGGLPVILIDGFSFDEEGMGTLIYFFELSCAMSAKLFGVNPFDQPGVEAYKKELKRLLNQG